ncbi:MAG: hypothetical protein LBH74_00595 [Nitrososphaerota archaeon]|jgi:hypothetical protein|uniref:hypothetical protein n=1 Tax=Candidatus Bathycorpusculum sp. TaxID=2994959 RepID=UPI00282A53B3|nr:hypothetical protein [Candidatus Termitimicrobium sp.]MDR0492128.1 hypothetical protein [Nitrososphaerota archaeon]
MNWRTVRYLISVERKSSRLLRGVKTTRYHEHRIIAYWPYWVSAIIGLVGGYLATVLTDAIYASSEQNMFVPLDKATLSVFVALPTIIMVGCVVLTMLQQIQLAGMKATRVVNYWLPITWQEHTLASILSNLLGFPLAIVIGVSAGILVFAVFNGLILAAALTTLMLFGAAFIASSTTEIVRILQTRFTGAVYKSSGKAAIWVRFVGTLLFFVAFYIVYFAIFQGSTALLQGLTEVQNTLWFVPFVWPGVTLYYLLNGIVLNGVLFLGLSVVFAGALCYFAVVLNTRFGLYEPPAITVQTKGSQYMPKTGILNKFGYSSIEAAIIRKDIRAFTRRRELISTFILPIVFIIVAVINSINLGNNGVEMNWIFEGMLFLFPGALMAMLLGNMLIGEEGQAVWRIYASPVSAQGLVKAKYTFLIVMSTITLIITGTVGAIFFRSSPMLITAAFLEALFLIFALGAIGLVCGFRGADFTGGRRQRMIRQEWGLISLLVCVVAGLAILAPLVPYLLGTIVGELGGLLPFTFPTMGPTELAVALLVSGIIATVITGIAYKINLNYAKELIRKAEI